MKTNIESEYKGNEKIYFKIIHGDATNFTETLSKIIPDEWPAFFFIDPYGYNISLPIIKSILQSNKREVLLNLMWSGINRNLTNPITEKSITKMFGHTNWQNQAFMETYNNEREALFLEYVKQEIGSRFAQHFKIKFGPDENMGDRTKYYLIHFSNHAKAMRVMKQIMHRIGDEEGTFDYSGRKQGILFSEKPELSQLKDFMINKYKDQHLRISFEDILTENYELPFVEKEYRKALKEMEGKTLDIDRIESKSSGLTDKDIIIFK